MEISSVVAALIGSAIGALASILTTRINVKGNTDAQIKLENLKRENINKEFRRNSLIELQTYLHKTIRHHALLVAEDLENFNKTNLWQKNQLSKENSNILLENQNKVTFYIERIPNNKLRKQTSELIRTIGKTHKTKDYKECLKISSQATSLYEIILLEIGIEIRKTY